MENPGAVDPRLLSAWQDVADGIIVLNSEHWTVLHVNSTGAALIGRAPADVVGHELTDLFPAAIGSDFHQQLRSARTTGSMVSFSGPFPGTDRYVQVRAQRFDDHVLCAFRDVTHEHAVQSERDSLLASVRDSLAHTTQLLELSEALSATVTVDDVARAVSDVAGRGFSASHAALSVVDHDRFTLHTPFLERAGAEAVLTWADMPLTGPGPGTECVRTGRPLFLQAEQLQQRYPELDHRWRVVRATAVLPLEVQGIVEGLLVAVWHDDHPFDIAERALLRALASYTAQALQRAQLLAERTATARTLQRSLLTAHLPQPPGLEIRARYVPAMTQQQVGGDWYDGLVLPGGSTMVVIGDVTGHDVVAAAAMGQLRIALRALAVDGDDLPSQLLSRLEWVLASLGGDPLMASALVGHILAAPQEELPGEATGRRFLWTNAGHPPPILVLADGHAEVLRSPPELLLGVAAGTSRSDQLIDVPEGATLLLYTDGLVERRDDDLDAGTERLRAAARVLASGDLGAALDALLAGLTGDSDAGAAGGADDVAVLAIRFDPPA